MTKKTCKNFILKFLAVILCMVIFYTVAFGSHLALPKYWDAFIGIPLAVFISGYVAMKLARLDFIKKS